MLVFTLIGIICVLTLILFALVMVINAQATDLAKLERNFAKLGKPLDEGPKFHLVTEDLEDLE